MLRAIGLVVLAIQGPDTTVVLQAGVRSPAFSDTGRLVFELKGDLWVADIPQGVAGLSSLADRELTRVTAGPAWDRDPAWTPDGSTLVFSSDRSGSFDIWRVAVGADGATGIPVRVTDAPEPESEPAVSKNGTIAFVRGRNANADIWLLDQEGSLRRLAAGPGAQLSPTFSPSGDSIAYVNRSGREVELEVRALEEDSARTVLRNVAVEYPAWSPDGNRIAYSTRGSRAGVWVTPLDGSYSNLVSEEAAEVSWAPDGAHLDGADAFYRGEVARRMVEDLRGQGNAMTLHDLSRYYAPERQPVKGTYREHTIYSSVPAASGGTSLVAKLNLLEQFRQASRYTDDAGTLHAMIEAWKLQPSSRGKIADPGLWPVDVAPLLNKDSARVRWERCFDPNRSTGPTELTRGRNGVPACAREVASAQVEDGSNCLANLDARSCRATGTSIAPTLIFRGTGDAKRSMAAVAAAGNAWITSAVYQMVAAMIDADLGPQEALELPRFLVSGLRRPGNADTVREVVIQIEAGIAPAVLRRLEDMGHVFQRISLPGELRMGYGAVVLIDGGRVRAGADPRRSGAAGAVR